MGEEDQVLRAASDWNKFGYGTAILIGREDVINMKLKQLNISSSGIEIMNAALSEDTKDFANHIYQRFQRKGFVYRDCIRLVNRDRNIFAAEMIIHKKADALVTGITRSYSRTLDEITRVIDIRTNHALFALSIVTIDDRNIFIADTTINENPSSEKLAVQLHLSVGVNANQQNFQTFRCRGRSSTHVSCR